MLYMDRNSTFPIINSALRSTAFYIEKNSNIIWNIHLELNCLFFMSHLGLRLDIKSKDTKPFVLIMG